jgi:hypothetical protein
MTVPINLPAIESLTIATEGIERRTHRQGTLADFFAASPLRESGLEIERPQDGLRLPPDDSLAEARLRGIEARQRLLIAEGGTLGVQEVASLLNISRQAAYKRYKAGRLLAVDCGRHGLAFPVWQLVPGGVLPGLEETLTALADFDPWMKLAFFLEENAALGGKTPLAGLRQGQLKDVLRAAELHGEHGAV